MNLNSTQGVYKITNKINGKIYIGSTTTPFSLRFGQHKSQLRGNRHFNPHLQYSWNKYGESNFDFSPIEVCDATQCLIREQHYIDTLHPIYNVIHQQRNHIQYKHNQSAKDRISIAFKGKNHPLYSGEYRFYHPKHGYFVGGLKEFPRRFGLSIMTGYNLKNEVLFQSKGWIYIGKSTSPVPEDINKIYINRINHNKPIYTFFNPERGTFCGTIPSFMRNYKIKHCNSTTIHSLTTGKRKMAWGWICVGTGDIVVNNDFQNAYNIAQKTNLRSHYKGNEIFSFFNPTHGLHTMPLKDFVLKFNLHYACVRRLCNNQRKSHLGWVITER